MRLPVIADNKPIQVTLEAGKTYQFCTCGRSANQPFCDGSHVETGFLPHEFSVERTQSAWLCMCKQTRTPPFCNGAHRHIMEDRVGEEA